MAVTGVADPDRLAAQRRGRPGLPISLTKPLGVGVLNNRHKSTGEVFPQAVEVMVALNDVARAAALARRRARGHRRHRIRPARPPLQDGAGIGVAAVVDAAAVPYLDGAREAVRDGFVPGGSRRNLDWVRPHLRAGVTEEELLLLADAQTSGGLLVAGEVPGAPVVGEVAPRLRLCITVR